MLSDEGELVYEQCQQRADQATEETVQKLGAVIQGMKSRLSVVARNFPEVFEESSLPSYTSKLCDFMDKELSDVLDQERAGYFDIAHEQTKAQILSELTSLLLCYVM